MNNPYDPPQSTLENPAEFNAAVDGKRRLFSPNQALGAALLGGMGAGIYVIYRNYLALNKPGDARKTVFGGVLMTVALLVVLYALPKQANTFVLSVMIAVGVKQMVKINQLDREDIGRSEQYGFESNWHTFAVGLISLVVSMVLLFLGAFVWVLVRRTIGA